MISSRERPLEEASLCPWALKEQHFRVMRESGHLPPTPLLGELRTGSCFWSRFCPAKKPAARLQNLPDRLSTATRWWGANLMVALGGAVAMPFSGMRSVPRWEAPGECTSLHPLAPISHLSPSHLSDALSLLSRLTAFFLLFLFLPTLLPLQQFSSSVCPFHFRQWFWLHHLSSHCGCSRDNNICVSSVYNYFKRIWDWLWPYREQGRCEGAQLQGQNWVLRKPQWPLVSPCFFCVPSSESEAWIHRLLWVLWSAVPQKLFVGISFDSKITQFKWFCTHHRLQTQNETLQYLWLNRTGKWGKYLW